MKTQIILTIALFFMIEIVSALDIYSGENVTIPLGFEIVNCSITENFNNLEGLNLSWNNNNIIISTHPQYKSDNLTISCNVIKYGDITEVNVGGSGRTKTIYKDRNITNYIPIPLNETIFITPNCINQTDVINLTPKKTKWIAVLWRYFRLFFRFLP